MSNYSAPTNFLQKMLFLQISSSLFTYVAVLCREKRDFNILKNTFFPVKNRNTK